MTVLELAEYRLEPGAPDLAEKTEAASLLGDGSKGSPLSASKPLGRRAEELCGGGAGNRC